MKCARNSEEKIREASFGKNTRNAIFSKLFRWINRAEKGWENANKKFSHDDGREVCGEHLEHAQSCH